LTNFSLYTKRFPSWWRNSVPKGKPKPPISLDVRTLLRQYNELYSMWQGQLEENADLKRENLLLRSQLKTKAYKAARPKS
jgi:hypothetical protein